MAYTSLLNLLLVDENWQFADDAFNRVIKDADVKLVGIDHLVSAMHWTEWKANTSYVVGDVVRWRNMRSHQYAKCITAGTSGGTMPTNNVTGSFVTDNNVEWVVCSLSADGSGISISIWLSGANYTRGDIVLYGGAFYRCKTKHTAGIWATDFNYWQEIFASIRNWMPNIYYFEGDSCIYNDEIYYCVNAHTSRPNFDATEHDKWLCLTSGRLSPWEPSIDYNAGEFVYVDNVIYQCLLDHTSDSSDFYSDRDTKWKVFHTPTATIKNWAVETYYEQNQVVLYNDNLYKCNTSHKSSPLTGTLAETFELDETKWDIIYSSIKPWLTSTCYKVGSMITFNGKIYRCNTEHISDNITDATELAYWDLVSGGGSTIKEWKQNTNFVKDDLVVYDGTLYKVDNDFTSGTTFDDTDMTPIMGEHMTDSEIDDLWL